MKIDKAIEILSTYMKGSDEAEPVEFDKAIKLGIEALKNKLEARRYRVAASSVLLPGETKE